ncbi:MAG TPA: ImmA/IrrE family metallo-endopeptidase [Candidatus Saccharimonadales bacterium]|nr:ImmA/IrrE family metallo-endopeptidase [Candidatus Saccharimonadales bacterium]
MKYKNIAVPFVGNSYIKNKADEFRLKFWGKDIPVEIEEIVEIKLKIKVIPIPDLMSQCGVDAQITSDFTSIYVDQKNYENDTNRFRFSLAHEVGHYVLHEKFYKDLKISSFADVIAFMDEIDAEEYSHLEVQANKFGNYLLLPRKELLRIRNTVLEEIRKKHDIKNIDEKTLNSYLAGYISSQFVVSSGATEIALNDLNNSK